MLHFLVLLTSSVLVFSCNTLVINKLTFGLSLSVLSTLRVHDRRILVHERVALSGRVGALVARVASNRVRLRQEGEERVPRRLPLDRELLQVDDLVRVHDFLDEVAGLLVVHRPNLLDALVVRLLKLLEALLQLDELVGEELVVLSVQRVLVLRLRLLVLELLELLAQALRVLVKLRLEALLLLLEDLLALVEYVVVEAELLLVQPVDRFHVLHALLEDLHLRLQLDLLLGLLVRVLTHHVLELLRVFLLLVEPLLQVVVFDFLVFGEERLDFRLVASEDGRSLPLEVRLNRLQLLVVVVPHLAELALHAHDELVDVLGHLLDRLDVVTVFLVNLLLELTDQLLLVGDDLGAGRFLRFDVL